MTWLFGDGCCLRTHQLATAIALERQYLQGEGPGKVAIGGAFAYGQSPEVRAVVSPVAQFVGHSAVAVGSALGKGVVVSTHFVGERALHPLGKTVVDSSVVAGKVVSGKAAVVGKTVGEKALDVGKSAGKHAVDSTVSLAEQIAARIKLATIGKTHAKRI